MVCSIVPLYHFIFTTICSSIINLPLKTKTALLTWSRRNCLKVDFYSPIVNKHTYISLLNHSKIVIVCSSLLLYKPCWTTSHGAIMYPHPNTPYLPARLPYTSSSLPRMEGALGCRRAHSHGRPAQPACFASIMTDNTRALFFGTFFCCSPVTKESTE